MYNRVLPAIAASLVVLAVSVTVSVAATLTAAPTNGTLIDHVWSGHPVPFGMLTERGHQFIAYYNTERKITVTGRKLGETNWTRVQPEGVWVTNRNRFSSVTGWDSHNYLTMALDRDGCLHLSGNLHADPLVYYRTEKPFDLGSLKRIDRMTGEREQRTTYPHFSKHPDGRLIFKYRDGGSGNGSDLYNVYDPDTRTWRRLFDGPLLDGEGERSAYSTGLTRGPDGFYHLLWMWRDTPDAMSNHTLSYARSRDLMIWETSAGKPIARPITMAKAEVVDAAKPHGGGLMNATFALGWDAEKRPVAAYHRYGTNGHSQIFVARADGKGGWQTRQISDWKFRWEFPGNGSQGRQVSVSSPKPSADGSLMVEFFTTQADSGSWRLDAKNLAVLERLTAQTNSFEPVAKPRGSFPGLQVQTQSSQVGDTRWLLRWETLGVNRDQMNRDVPPPSELRLYEFRDTDRTNTLLEITPAKTREQTNKNYDQAHQQTHQAPGFSEDRRAHSGQHICLAAIQHRAVRRLAQQQGQHRHDRHGRRCRPGLRPMPHRKSRRHLRRG